MDQAITDELREMESRLASLPRILPFAAPEAGFFAALPAALTAGTIAAAGPDPVAEWGTELPYEVPEGYFNGLAGTLAHAAQLRTASQTQPFDVPDGYFASLPAELLNTAKTASKSRQESKTRSFPLLRKSVPWLAAAAIMAGVWFGVSRETAGPTPDNRALTALATLDQDSIGAYVEQHVDDFDPENLESTLAGVQITDFHQAVSELRSDEIEEYLNDAGAAQNRGDGI